MSSFDVAATRAVAADGRPGFTATQIDALVDATRDICLADDDLEFMMIMNMIGADDFQRALVGAGCPERLADG